MLPQFIYRIIIIFRKILKRILEPYYKYKPWNFKSEKEYINYCKGKINIIEYKLSLIYSILSYFITYFDILSLETCIKLFFIILYVVMNDFEKFNIIHHMNFYKEYLIFKRGKQIQEYKMGWIMSKKYLIRELKHNSALELIMFNNRRLNDLITSINLLTKSKNILRNIMFLLYISLRKDCFVEHKIFKTKSEYYKISLLRSYLKIIDIETIKQIYFYIERNRRFIKLFRIIQREIEYLEPNIKKIKTFFPKEIKFADRLIMGYT